MLARYTTSFADFSHAQRLHIRRKPLGTLRYIVFVWILPVVGALCAAALLYDITLRQFSLRPWQAAILGGVGWAGLWNAIYRPILHRRLYRQMKNGRPDHAPIELELRGEELISRVPGFSEGRFLRTAVHDFAEDDRLALLYLRKNLFLMLPRQQIAESDLAQVRAWLAGTPTPAPQPGSPSSLPPPSA